MDKYELALYARSNNMIVEAMGMVAENQAKICEGDFPKYREDDFNGLANRHGVNENDIRDMLNG